MRADLLASIRRVRRRIDAGDQQDIELKVTNINSPVTMRGKTIMDEATGFHREVTDFVNGFGKKFVAWLEQRPKLDREAKKELRESMEKIAVAFATLANGVATEVDTDGDETDIL